MCSHSNYWSSKYVLRANVVFCAICGSKINLAWDKYAEMDGNYFCSSNCSKKFHERENLFYVEDEKSKFGKTNGKESFKMLIKHIKRKGKKDAKKE